MRHKYIVVHGIKIAKDFVPETFGRLTTLGPRFIVPEGRQKDAKQVCLCACGTVGVFCAYKLKKGNTRSCGCLLAAITANRSITHGKSHTTEYLSWKSMKSRCHNVNNRHYPDYGGRGICVFPDWLGPTGFETWLAHIGPKPLPGMTQDRIDVNGNYEPGNVRWATPEEQANNTRRAKKYAMGGRVQYLTVWCRELQISPNTVKARLKRGLSASEAFGLPHGMMGVQE